MHMAIASAFIGSSASRVLIALLVAVAVALFVVAVTVLLGRSQAKVERQLAGYELPDIGDDAGSGAWASPRPRWCNRRSRSRLASRSEPD